MLRDSGFQAQRPASIGSQRGWGGDLEKEDRVSFLCPLAASPKGVPLACPSPGCPPGVWTSTPALLLMAEKFWEMDPTHREGVWSHGVLKQQNLPHTLLHRGLWLPLALLRGGKEVPLLLRGHNLSPSLRTPPAASSRGSRIAFPLPPAPFS